MTATEIIEAFERLGVELRVRPGEQLEVQAAEAPPNDLFEELRRQKDAVIAVLRSRPAVVKVVDRRLDSAEAGPASSAALLDATGHVLTEGTDANGHPVYPDMRRPSGPSQGYYPAGTREITDSELFRATGVPVVARSAPGPHPGSVEGISQTLALLRAGR